MVCVYCSHDTQVVNSRLQKRLNQVWRRRRCVFCKNVFTTIETADLAMSLRFRNALGDLEPFSRDKLLISIYESCRHRKDAAGVATALTHTVLSNLRHSFKDVAVDRVNVINVTHQTLKLFDRTAALLYGAFHPKA